MSHKIGFLVSEFLPTKEFIKTSLNNLQKDDLKVYFFPIYSPNKKSNNKLLFKVLRDTSLNYIIYKIFDTLYINFIRKLKKDNIKYFVKKNNIAYENLEPQYIANYLQQLASFFHKFYSHCKVITDDADLTAARIELIKAVKVILSNGFNILGISSPERM